MKTETTGFGFEILVTYLLPGILATGAVVIAHGIGAEGANKILIWSKDAQLLASILLITSFALFGALIASLQAVLETCILDKITPKIMGKAKDKYFEEWDYYIKNLPKNSYVSRVVLFFQFETRLGLASFILGLTLFKLSCVHAIIFILLGIFFYIIGVFHHKELAEFRETFCEKNA